MCGSAPESVGEYLGRRQNQLLLLTLADYLFFGADTADKYSLRHDLFKTAVSISHFAH